MAMMHTDEPVWTYMSRVARQMGILPALTVCECAVGPIEQSIAPGFVGKCDRLLLIEPLPYYAQEAERVLHTKVLKVAVGMEPGLQLMVDTGVMAHLVGTWAPRTDVHGHEISVEVVTFDTLDDERIEIFNLDCEGQEWAVLSKMKSRPKLLSIELYKGNPYLTEIKEWLKENNYIMRLYSGPENETELYVRQ
jgi:FkbM family methyltransferase